MSCEEDGYALASVLFLVTVLSVLCAIILKVELGKREAVLKSIDLVKSQSASDNGIFVLSTSLQSQPSADSTFSIPFDDGSSVTVEVYPWGLFTGVISKGLSHKSESVRSTFLASLIGQPEDPAMVLGNLQHGLVFAGSAEIIGDVAVGPMGVSTGSLKNAASPRSAPITGKKMTLSSPPTFSDTLAMYRHVFLTRTLFSRVRGSRTSSEERTAAMMECSGSLNLRNVSDSINYAFCNGTLSLGDTIMRRGPPLYIVVLGGVSFRPHAFLSGPISVCSIDSIVIPSTVSINNCILTSEKSITLNSCVAAQLFSPVIHFSSNASASYPSIAASVSFSDTSTAQNIQLDEGARIEGAVMMHRANATSMDKAVITLAAGATVVGGIYTDAYLTLDGTVDGYVRTFDLYFYDSPTTYLGWMRQGVIDRTQLPHGFLKPVGISRNDTLEVLTWL
jgi:hypothetical protein